MFLTLIKRIIPKSIKNQLREAHRRYVFDKSIKEFARLRGDSLPGRKLLAGLIYGWGNEGYSAETEYLSSLTERALKTRGPILECGSGLSTVLLGLIAKRTGNAVWTLEHHPEWADRVRSVIKGLGLDSVQLCLAPLRDFQQFDWYDAPLEKMPNNFQLVVCDGPPGDTRGGRYGMLPLMREYLSSNCTILLDDAAREEEKAILEKWTQELGTRFEIEGSEKPYAVLVVP
jgi:hypothetical protein